MSAGISLVYLALTYLAFQRKLKMMLFKASVGCDRIMFALITEL